jgi:Tfp pilus assembly protein PilX
MASKTNTIFKNQSGTALVVALIMMVVITLIALASSYTSIFEIKISGNKRGATNAFYATDAGINILTSYPTYCFNSNFTVTPPNTTSTNSTPFGNLPSPYNNLPNQNVPISVTGSITYFSNQSGPDRKSVV